MLRVIVRRSRSWPSLQAAADREETQLPDSPDGLADDVLRHLRLAAGAIDEDDGYLADAEPTPPGTHAHLDLEAVPFRFDAGEVDGFEDFAAKCLEAAGEVPDRQAGDAAGVDVREIGE